MADGHAPAAAHLEDSLNQIRAAIDVVQRGTARRVIVSDPAGEAILSAARALGRVTGVTIESRRRAGAGGIDIEIRARPPGR
jgi:hypothetical protein